jgi:predicted phosphodiesterase
VHATASPASSLLVFGGPYSNLQATLAMRDAAERLGIPPQRTICTGDVVAYGADPEETVQAVRDWGIRVIQGNCEQQLAADAEDCGCGFEEGTACDRLSKGWYDYARRRVSAASRRWMGALPPAIDLDLAGRRIKLVHGGVSEVSRFVFRGTDARVKRAELTLAGADMVIGGHCGIPFLERLGRKIWLNAGVIGMPANDGTRDGWYALLAPSADGLAVLLHRLAYDAEAAARRMRAAGHADPYAEALLTGRWPSEDVLPDRERRVAGRPLASTTTVLASPHGAFNRSQHGIRSY